MIKSYFLLLLLSSVALAQSPVPSGAKLITVSTGIEQPEGPVWKDGNLLFSDIQGNVIYKWSPVDSLRTVFLSPSWNSNGLTLDKQGRLILTQMGLRRVSRQETDGTITVLTATFRGKRYNSPNDIVVKSDGSIFFTDPDYNVPAGQSPELNFKGIYRISPSGVVTLLDSTFDKPNGICFSPDEKRLYVNDTPVRSIYMWDVVDDSTITNRRLFYQIPSNSGGVDGMKVDQGGNIYCAGPNGLWIISSTGTYLDKIPISVGPSNCAWGDSDGKTLYITGGYGDGTLYKIHLAPATGVEDYGALPKAEFELYANYPNPFNPSTNISFSLPKRSFVSLKVFDLIGREITTLLSEELPAGNHTRQWNANREPSGIYLYRLQAGSFTETKKLILLK